MKLNKCHNETKIKSFSVWMVYNGAVNQIMDSCSGKNIFSGQFLTRQQTDIWSEKFFLRLLKYTFQLYCPKHGAKFTAPNTCSFIPTILPSNREKPEQVREKKFLGLHKAHSHDS